MRLVLRSVWIVGFLTVALTAAQAGDIIFLVRTGTDAEGNPQFRTANGSDTALSGVYDLVQNSRAVREASRYYDDIQRDKLAVAMQAQGASSQDIQTAIQSARPEPTYIEVSNSNAGSYNDWKGRFSIIGPDGRSQTISTPRIVFPLAGEVPRSGDNGLIEQTIVHEIGHGAMFKASGADRLPESDDIGKPHSGGSVTDPKLALVEGWAEFIGAYFTGRLTIAQDPNGAIDSNWYAKNQNGQFKSPDELFKTEGWAATLLYRISTLGKDQNAMWKLTQTMTRTGPQSLMDFLNKTVQLFPEMGPVINQALYRESNGQLGSPQAQQYAGGGSYGNNFGGAMPPGGGKPDGGTGDGGAPPGVMARPPVEVQPPPGGGEAYAGNPPPQGGGEAPGVDPTDAAAVAEDTQQLARLVEAKQRELDTLPFWKFFNRSKLQQELQQLQELYNKQKTLQAGYTAAPGNTARALPAAPLSGRRYRSVVEALNNHDIDGAKRNLEALRQRFEKRQALRAVNHK
jgi:hypothetical protein